MNVVECRFCEGIGHDEHGNLCGFCDGKGYLPEIEEPCSLCGEMCTGKNIFGEPLCLDCSFDDEV